MDGTNLRRLALAGVLFGLTGVAWAQQEPAVSGYVTDNSGNVVRGLANRCVESEARASEPIPQCNPQAAQAAPFMAVEQPTRVTRLINLEADTTFAFDSAQLTPEGKNKLDQLVSEVRGTQDQRVRIAGYTDWIGPPSYNQQLSVRRADAVRNYLVSKGIPADSIQAVGRGEQNPVVSCENLRGQALVTCLRPDRRAEIEFSAFEVVNQPQNNTQQQQQQMNQPSTR